MDRGSVAGGIFGLILLLEEHRAAFDYDWRTRFNLPAAVIGESMPWDEAVRLTRILRADPASMLAAAMEGWEYPVSREALALYDLFDLNAWVNSTKGHRPKPHPGRPGKQPNPGEHMGDTSKFSQENVRAILAAARHGLAAPV